MSEDVADQYQWKNVGCGLMLRSGRKIILPLVLMLLSSVVIPRRATASAVELYVAPDGSGGSPGTRKGPFASLPAARDAIRQIRRRENGNLPEGAVTVWIRGGRYRMSSTFTLDKQDSGTMKSPVIYRAFGDKEVILDGGVPIAATAFKPVNEKSVLRRLHRKVRSKLVAADVRSLGLDHLFSNPMRTQSSFNGRCRHNARG